MFQLDTKTYLLLITDEIHKLQLPFKRLKFTKLEVYPKPQFIEKPFP